MSKLDGVDRARLQAALDGAGTAKSAKRLMVALAYTDGVGVGAMSERYGIPRSTIYYWLDRFEERELADAVEDQGRPGRPPRLSEEQRARLDRWLESPPEDAKRWTADRLQQRISEAFGVEYSVAHVSRRFLS